MRTDSPVMRTQRPFFRLFFLPLPPPLSLSMPQSVLGLGVVVLPPLPLLPAVAAEVPQVRGLTRLDKALSLTALIPSKAVEFVQQVRFTNAS